MITTNTTISSQTLDFGQLAKENGYIIAIFGLFFAVIVFLYFRCKSECKTHIEDCYIDFKTKRLFCETEFRVTWGWRIFLEKKIDLYRIKRTDTFNLYIQPQGELKRSLGSTRYFDAPLDAHEKTLVIFLQESKKFPYYLVHKPFEELFYLETESIIEEPLDERIVCKITDKEAFIENTLQQDVENYEKFLPIEFEMRKLSRLQNKIRETHTVDDKIQIVFQRIKKNEKIHIRFDKTPKESYIDYGYG